MPNKTKVLTAVKAEVRHSATLLAQPSVVIVLLLLVVLLALTAAVV